MHISKNIWSKNNRIDFFQVPNFLFRLSMYPKCSMYGICVYIYPKTGPNVGKNSIHGASGNCRFNFSTTIFDSSWPSSKDGLRENPKQKPLFSHQL